MDARQQMYGVSLESKRNAAFRTQEAALSGVQDTISSSSQLLTRKASQDAAKPFSRTTLGDLSVNLLPVSDTSKLDSKSALSKPNAAHLRNALSSLQQKNNASSKSSIPKETFLDPRIIDGVFQSEFADADRKRRKDWVDVDSLNHEDPQACSHYAQAICEHLREAELTRRPNPRFLEVQPEINAKMRCILVDWMVEVAEEYKLCADTLYQAVNYLDRFLSIHKVQRAQLQLAGVTCMWIAAKYEEIYPPNVNEFSYITDNTYSKEQLVEMEEVILKKLKYELTVPTAKTFLRRLLQVCNPDEQLHFLSNYLTEITLMDHNFNNFLPSEIAAAAVYLSQLVLSRAPWTATLEHYSAYSVRNFSQVLEALATLHCHMHAKGTAGELTALYDKYGHSKYLAVSKFQPLTVHQVSEHVFKVLGRQSDWVSTAY